MSDAQKESFLWGALISVFVSAIVFLWIVARCNFAWQRDAIKHGAARYNATTGTFEWIDKQEATK